MKYNYYFVAIFPLTIIIINDSLIIILNINTKIELENIKLLF